MLLHLLIAFGLLVSVLALGQLLRLIIRSRSDRLVGHSTEHPTPLPTILYFTSESCAPCKLQQSPALARLRKTQGDTFTLQTIDVAEDAETARRYRVLSAPTTVVIDPAGTVRAVNVGVASTETLQQQLA